MATSKTSTKTAEGSSLKATKTGVVQSDQRDKTRKVVVSYLDPHPKYGKYIRKRTVLHVHDEKNESKVGDIVEVAQCRPLSKTKSWRMVKIVEKRSEQAAAVASAMEVR
jgi:small subunit ribosomal protein S17